MKNEVNRASMAKKTDCNRASMAMEKSILVWTALVAMVLFGCKENPYINAPGDNSQNKDSIPVIQEPEPTPDPEGVAIPDSCLTVTEALEIGKALANDVVTTKKYYIKGWIQSLHSDNASGISSYGNATFFMAESNTGKNRKTFEAYQVYGKNGKKIGDVSQVQPGDFVIVYGAITKHNGVVETQGKGAANIYYSTNPNFDPQMDPTKITPDPEGADVPEGTLTVYEALHVSDSIGSGSTTSGEYYIKGWIRRLDSKYERTFYIAATNDGSTDSWTFEAFKIYGKNNSPTLTADQYAVGDFVVLRCKIKNYNGIAENSYGYIYYSTNPNF